MREPKAGSLRSRIVDRFLDELGITREHVDKLTQIWDQVDVKETKEGIEINIKLKNIQVKVATDDKQSWM